MSSVPNIHAVSDLRNNFKKITDLAETLNKPIFLTKNGKGSLVVMSMEAYEQDLFKTETYLKLKEAEYQAKTDAPRVTYKDARAKAMAVIKAAALKDE
ncbi:MAG: type II toxin-antitoxin system Phd/YefM family antitoxin [Treponema sp.]|jgi:prevent-host-death family protein|nr:type II toxin-antitoxin system Phd/YefM family antitoxin [Treponema sp.]